MHCTACTTTSLHRITPHRTARHHHPGATPASTPPAAYEERTLPSDRFPRLPGRAAIPDQNLHQGLKDLGGTSTGPRLPGLERFNTAPAEVAENALLACCDSLRWARRLAAHRPYPDLASLLAAADEAAYDLTPDELHQALAAESAHQPGTDSRAAATALRAAHAAYESRFGHVFVICLDDVAPEETLDQVLAGIRSRLNNDPEDERVQAAEELRGVARGRISRLLHGLGGSPMAYDWPAEGIGPGPESPESVDSGRPDSPYVQV
ncbi:2-oxo-4-hydroxy-4-carboxy-5-ureidoimidazoline decarboxylase [Streptomyces sp. PSKA28]|uniref:2-oxo-4-hydroxy-4-carboxy-5-ureidoimidazoline decarboxylase n=1 Tax=Streptomyces himalayensis subsp. himalayensis TaxID=2756131 RepID=A0A7W0DPK7_9ACTN|nr:2-oxo-4-hydroxy-4-carboxy-5-ureidoimidazoline decarboxylase [Streptomyces himalayensis subsp. himalayensis]